MARREGHHFGAGYGFSGSAGKSFVKPHTRTPARSRPKPAEDKPVKPVKPPPPFTSAPKAR